MSNIVINGGLEFDQEHEGSAINLGSSNFLCDGFVSRFISANGGAATCQRVSDAPDGFSFSLKATVTTAASSVAVGDRLSFVLPLEAYLCNQLAFGTASAKNINKNFWVKSSVAGTFGVSLINQSGNRSRFATFSCAANTWTSISFSNITGDVSGSWPNTGAFGYLVISPVAGSNFQDTNPSTWQSANFLSNTTQTNTHLTTVNSTFQIAGIALSIGGTSIPYESDPYEFLKVCRRYSKSYDQGVGLGTATYSGCEYIRAEFASDSAYGHSTVFSTPMISAPTVTYYSPSNGATGVVFDANNAVNKTVSPFYTSQKGFAHTVFGLGSGFGATYHWTADCRLS